MAKRLPRRPSSFSKAELRYTAPHMFPKRAPEIQAAVNPFTAEDVAAILRERGWLRHENEGTSSAGELVSESASSWMAEAAALLGPRAENRGALACLLEMIFEYDARVTLTSRECQEVLAREGAREVIRVLATEILKGGPVDSNRLKEIVATIKATLPYSSRDIFHPLRVVLAGHLGGGELDRVVLLLDRAALLEGLAPVKTARTRILEFCAALD
jgi:anticodon-binding protein